MSIVVEGWSQPCLGKSKAVSVLNHTTLGKLVRDGRCITSVATNMVALSHRKSLKTVSHWNCRLSSVA
ncbi:hypothetical protein IG631_13731 [Alternaria alternata]|nr:hypothetical protein IG631_13731 [Alternaria alternata]